MNDRTSRDDLGHDVAATVHRRDIAAMFRLLVAAAFVVALVLVGFDNRAKVRVGYVFGEAQAAVWLVVVGSALAGMIIAWLVKHNRRQ